MGNRSLSEHILIVDDEAAIRDMVRMALEMEGFEVSDASNAHQAEKLIESSNINLVLLDWMMPGVSGIDFASKLSKRNASMELGIIMLTAKDEEENKVRGFEVGADDYVTKPFSIKELVSRIRAVLRRINVDNFPDSVINAGKITIQPDQHRVQIDGAEVEFSPTEFRLLFFLANNPNRVYARNQLLDNVWGEHVYVDDRTVDVHIRRVRKVLEPFDCDNYIRTIRGVGYRFSVA